MFAFREINAICHNGFVYSSKLILEKYPNFEAAIPKNNDKTCIVNRKNLINAIRRVNVLSNQKTKLIKLDIENNNIEVSVSNFDLGGEANQNLNCVYISEKIELGINAMYFLEILNLINDDYVKLDIGNSVKGILIYSSDKDGVKQDENLFLTMPLRLNKNK